MSLRYFVYSTVHILSLFLRSTVPFGLLRKFLHSLTSPHYAYRISLSVLSKTRLQKPFSLYAGALLLWHTFNLNRHIVGCGCHEILIQCSFSVLFLTHLCHSWSTSSSFSLAAVVSQMQEVLDKMVISFENWSESSFFQWFSRQFSSFAQTLCCVVYSSPHLCLSFSASLRPLVGLRPPARVQSFTLPAVSLSICQSKTQLEKAFSLHAGALSLGHSLPQ